VTVSAASRLMTWALRFHQDRQIWPDSAFDWQ
jgi:hypothetical protein